MSFSRIMTLICFRDNHLLFSYVRKGQTHYLLSFRLLASPALPTPRRAPWVHSQDCFTHGALVAVGLAIWATHGVIFSGAEKISILQKAPKFTTHILNGGEKAIAWLFSWK